MLKIFKQEMTIIQLQYILAVHKYKNFTTAAEYSFVTQPTLSMQIQKLEDELDIKIFDRSAGHPIQTTKIGLVIVEQAEYIIQQTKKIKTIINEEKGAMEGEFTLGIIPTVLPDLVPRFLKNYLKTYPEIKLVIKELSTNQIIKEIREGIIDVGIAVTPLEEKDILEIPLYYEPFVAFIPENHKLAHKSILTRKSLKDTNLLLLEEGHCFRNNVLNFCDINNTKKKRVSFESGNLDVLVNLARNGFGITLLPFLHAEGIEKTEKNRIRHFISPAPTREVSLIYCQSMLSLSFLDSLYKAIRSALGNRLLLNAENKKVISPKA